MGRSTMPVSAILIEPEADHGTPGPTPGRRQRAARAVALIEDAIRSGRLAVGDQLPSTRQLSAALGIARGTVQAAISQLVAIGILVSSPRAGTFVAATVPAHTPTTETLQAVSSGSPDLEAFPRRAWVKALDAAIADGTHLAYGDAQGELPLRRAIRSRLADYRGIRASTEEIVITAGVSGALHLLSLLLREPGFTDVFVEELNSRSVRRTLDFGFTHVHTVDVDDEGAIVDSLPRRRTVALLTPAQHYRTGVPLSGRRRRELIAWARSTGSLIIEDDYSGELSATGPVPPPLQPLGPDVVLYTSSVSKSLSPALRLGWIVAPAVLSTRLAQLRDVTGLSSPAFLQIALSHIMENGTYDRHLRQQRRILATKYALVRDSLASTVPEAYLFPHAAGSTVAILLAVDERALSASAKRAGLAIRSLSTVRTTPGPQGVFLTLSSIPLGQIDRVVDVIASAHLLRRGSGHSASPWRHGPIGHDPTGSSDTDVL